MSSSFFNPFFFAGFLGAADLEDLEAEAVFLFGIVVVVVCKITKPTYFWGFVVFQFSA